MKRFVLVIALMGQLFCTSFLLSKEFHYHASDYLIAENHPIKHKLDLIFQESNAIASPAALKKAGFQTVSFRSKGSLWVVKHPKMRGYLFKIYTDSVTFDDHNRFRRLIRRAAIATEVRKLVQHHHMKHFTVPDKWLYEVPHAPIAKDAPPIATVIETTITPAKSYKRYVLVVTDMKLTSRKKSEKAWKKRANSAILRELYQILEAGYTSLSITQNLPYTKEKTFACIDTEYEARKFKLLKIQKYLSPEMRKKWARLVQQHKR